MQLSEGSAFEFPESQKYWNSLLVYFLPHSLWSGSGIHAAIWNVWLPVNTCYFLDVCKAAFYLVTFTYASSGRDPVSLCAAAQAYCPCPMPLLLYLNSKGSLAMILTLDWICVTNFSKGQVVILTIQPHTKDWATFFMMGNESTHAIHMTTTWFLPSFASIRANTSEINKNDSVPDVSSGAIRGMNLGQSKKKGPEGKIKGKES